MSDHIPDDVLIQILSRLPITSLLRFRSVSKSWRSLINTTPTSPLHSHTLIAYFPDKIGKPISRSFLKTSAVRFCDELGPIQMFSNRNHPGFFLFAFSHAGIVDAVLENGPWFVAGKPLILRRWRQPGMGLVKDNLVSVLIWVKFFGVPLELWTADGWGYVASGVGTPLFMDEVTQKRSRLRYGRICVEVSAEKLLIEEFKLRMPPDETVFPVRVEYDWKQWRCDRCLVFGHTVRRSCELRRNMAAGKGKSVWVPKREQSSTNG